MGGNSPGDTAVTEEYNNSFEVTTAAAWASGGNMNLARKTWCGMGTLTAGLVAVCIAAFVGTVLGLISGYFGKITDSIIMRLTDAMLSLPIILIALLFAVTLGPSFTNLIIVQYSKYIYYSLS